MGRELCYSAVSIRDLFWSKARHQLFQVNPRSGLTLLRSELIPHVSFHQICVTGNARFTSVSDRILRFGVSLFGGLSKPAYGLGDILGNATPIEVTRSKIELRLNRAMFRGSLNPLQGMFKVILQADRSRWLIAREQILCWRSPA